jgi:hypothetical protein
LYRGHALNLPNFSNTPGAVAIDLDGIWYMIVLQISGGIAVIFFTRGFIFGLENLFDFEVPIQIKVILSIMMLLAFILLIVGLGWLSVTA